MTCFGHPVAKAIRFGSGGAGDGHFGCSLGFGGKSLLRVARSLQIALYAADFGSESGQRAGYLGEEFGIGGAEHH